MHLKLKLLDNKLGFCLKKVHILIKRTPSLFVFYLMLFSIRLVSSNKQFTDAHVADRLTYTVKVSVVKT